MQRTSGRAPQKEIAERSGVDPTTISRWKRPEGGTRPENVAAFARAYGRPVLEAFVAAGYLTAEEAEGRIRVSVVDPGAWSDEQLVEALTVRLQNLRRSAGREDEFTKRRQKRDERLSPAPAVEKVPARKGGKKRVEVVEGEHLTE